MDNLYFDELQMKETFEKAIAEYYKNDDRYEEGYWFKFFGNRDLKFYSSMYEANTSKEKPHFPCVIIDIESTPNSQWSNSTQIEEISSVSFNIEFFTTDIGNVDKTISSYKLSTMILLALRQVSGNITVTRNAPILNIDRNVCRRIIRGAFQYNNKTKTFYKGD